MVTLWSINSWTLKMNEHHRFLEWKRIFQPRWMAESMLLEGTIFGEKNIYKPAIKGTVWVPGFWLLAICVSEWGIPQFLLIFTDVHEMMINHQIHAFGWVVAVLHASGWCLFFFGEMMIFTTSIIPDGIPNGSVGWNMWIPLQHCRGDRPTHQDRSTLVNFPACQKDLGPIQPFPLVYPTIWIYDLDIEYI